MFLKVITKYYKLFIVVLIISVVLRLIYHQFDQRRNQEIFKEGILIITDHTTKNNPTDSPKLNNDFNPIFLEPGYKRNDDYNTERIPHIIHQIWDTYDIPDRFIDWLKTWKSANPDWQHWMWSLDDARKLIETHYKTFLSLYDSYESSIFRADAARYFIIHHFGGVYADLDMKSILPLDNWTHAYDCVISEEPYEHSFVIREQNHSNVLNGFIACQENHPFMESTINLLMEAAGKYFGDYLRATGPSFFTNSYHKWIEKKTKNNDHSQLLVVPPKYFFPTFDRSQSEILSSKCHPKALKNLPHKGQLVCRALIFRGHTNEVDVKSYTDHDWLHSYMFGDSFKTKNVKHISDISSDIMIAFNFL